MSALLSEAPYGARDDAALLCELSELTEWHRAGCAEYARMIGAPASYSSFAELPYVHVSTFKHVLLRTAHAGLAHGRTLLSSSTTGSSPSRISLDEASSALQSQSAAAILRDFVGASPRPLVVLDTPASLRRRTDVAARVAAALGLRALASDVHFVLSDDGDAPHVRWEKLAAILLKHEDVLVYGVSFLLWQTWGLASPPREVAELLAERRVTFVHSGGWKRLEHAAVDRATFDAALLAHVAPGSRVVDFYGLVEQNGVVFPFCEGGVRHVPRWAHVIIRDARTLAPTHGEGLLHALNPLARGAPYHSVLTEDLARMVDGACPCGREAPAFTLHGRLASAPARGCSDVAVSPSRSVISNLRPPPDERDRPVRIDVGPAQRLVLKHDLEAVFEGFGALSRRMARAMPSAFTRDEWAYLLRFVEPGRLRALVERTFTGAAEGPKLYFRPRSPVAVWLPATVSLMGPLMVVLTSLSGARATLKASTRGIDLTSAFMSFAQAELTGTPLGAWLTTRAQVLCIPPNDPRHRELAAAARLRVVFGSDETARQVDALPHPAQSLGLHFTERSSEAWLDARAAADPATVAALLSVFDVYGQAACTAPRRAVVVGATVTEARAFAEALAAAWSGADSHARDRSEAVVAAQWGRAAGWTVFPAKARPAGVVLFGTPDLPAVRARLALHVVAATREEALRSLSNDIQTIGVAFGQAPIDDVLVTSLVASGVARVVPLAEMHHFGGQWDGLELLRSLFEVTVVET